jgi:pimeloyl-ACP methyl ester carboxylesterase
MLVGALLIAACDSTVLPSAGPTAGATAGATAPAPSFQPTFAAVPCPADVTSQVVVAVTCGYLTVLEDRTKPGGRTIQLFVLRIDPPGGTTTVDPVLAIGHLGVQDGYGDMSGSGQRTHRVLYLFDPRGVGHSTPSLACPEVSKVSPDLAGLRLRDPARRSLLLGAVAACHDRLVAQGIDVGAYDIGENTADVEDLRASLGIDTWNVMAYGSPMGFEVARRYPAAVRSLVVDSPMLPSPDFLTVGPAALDDSITHLTAACSLDPACNRAAPDLRAEIRAAINKLDANPETFEVSGTIAAINLGRAIKVVVDGAALVRIIRWSLGASGGSSAVRAVRTVGAVMDGSLAASDPAVVALASDIGDCLGLLVSCEEPTLGVLYSVLCRDFATPDPAVLQADINGRPAYRDVFSPSPLLAPCDAWHVSPAPPFAQNGATGGVPTLVLRGVFDPYSASAAQVAAAVGGTTNVYSLDVPNQSYNTLGYTECPRAIRNAWVDAPTAAPADTSCLAAIPKLDLTP